MKTFLRVLFYLFIWLLIFGVVIGVALFLSFTPIEGAIAACGLFVLWLLYRLIKRLFIRMHAKGRIKQLIRLGREDEATKQIKVDTSGLDHRFTHAMRLLKNSPLTHASDPVYQLPWTLVLPDNSSDCERLVSGGRLILPSGHKEIFSGDECQTQWWMHNEGVLVQTPLSVLESSGGVHPEWGRLLELLASKRPSEPISHIALTVSIKKLQQMHEDALYQHGLVLRERLDQVVQTLKVNAPVYLIFTDLDQIPGGSSLIRRLPEHVKRQAFGQRFVVPAGQTEGIDAEQAVSAALDAISEQLKQINLELMGRGVVDDGLLQLPAALDELKADCRSLVRGIFQNSVFQASPELNGVYWTGSMLTNQEEGGAEGLFVRELFTDVLPNDRGLVNKIPTAVKAERWIRNLWFTGFAATVVVVWVALIYAYMSDRGFLNQLEETYAGQIVERSDLGGNITNGTKLIDLIGDLNQHSFVPWIDDASEEPIFIVKLKAIFVDRVWSELVQPIDRRIERSLNKALFTTTLPPDEAAEEIARFVGILVREINILQNFLAGKDLESLKELPPLYQAEDRLLHEELAESELDNLNNLYLMMLTWSSSTDNYQATLDRKQRLLKRILADHPDNLDWLVNWGNTAGKSNEVRLADFWQGSVPLNRAIRVAPAFTLAGKEMIDDFIEQILATDQAAEQINALIPGFKESYRKRYLDAWQQFALNFYQGSSALGGPLDWQTAVDLQATGRNPFFSLLDRMAEELDPFKEMESMPDWFFLVNYYKEMANYAPADRAESGGKNPLVKLALKAVGKAGAAGKAVAGAGKTALKTQKKLNKGKKKGGALTDEERLAVLEQAGALLGQYRQLIESIVFNSAVRSVSFTSIASMYTNPDNPALGESALAQSYSTIRQFQGLLGKRSRRNEAFWVLFTGSVQLFREYMTSEAACELQDRWENRFLAGLQGVPGYKKSDFLYGEGGHLWTFKDAELNPFVKPRFGAGFVPVRADGETFPLDLGLLEYLSRGDDFRKQQQSQYTVIIKAQPTSTNPEALYLPRRTVLELQCEDGTRQLENLNFAQDKAFQWGQSCTDATLLINVGRYTLEKRYGGIQGFPHFLRDFQSGQKRFVPADFPLLEDRLTEYKVKYIDVRYQFRGQRPVIRTLAASELKPPRYIADCWSS